MLEVGAFQAKNTLGSLLDKVEQGEEVIITRHGKPVARLVPASAGVDRTAARAALERIRERAKQFKGQTFDWEEWKAYRDEGRK